MMKKAVMITWRGALCLEEAESVRHQLIEALGSGHCVKLDLTSVEAIDIAGLQLLCSAHRTARAAGLSFSLATPFPHLVTTAARQAGFLCSPACSVATEKDCLWDDIPGAYSPEAHHG
jgi:anti-anti-sigma regulatory factor